MSIVTIIHKNHTKIDTYISRSSTLQSRKILEKSFATVSPTRLSSAMSLMLSPAKKREMTSVKARQMVKKNIISSYNEVMNKMGSLDKKVRTSGRTLDKCL